MKSFLTGMFLAGTLFISCKTAKKNRNVKNIDTVTVSAFNNPMNIYRAAAPRSWNILHTRAALTFDYKEKTAEGQAWLTLQPYFYAADTLHLDAKGMKIERVTTGNFGKVLQYTYDSSQLHIVLDKTYTKEDQLKIAIQYVAMPYAMTTGGSAAIRDDRGLYFINSDNKTEGKPVQIWTQGETESNSHWLPTIDKPNMRTPVQLELTVPAQYKTLSNGALVSSIEKGLMRTDTWKTEEPIQVYAIMFAIGDFVIAKDKWRDKEVNYYVEQAYAPYARKMFQYTPEMMEFFSSVTGVPYPWSKYSQVVVRDYVSGAMENTSASLFGEFMNQDHREYDDANHEDVVSHELFHQWFGDYVTAESWSNLTVNESFATYGEYLWRKHKYGLSYADELAWSDLKKYINYAAYADPVLVRHHYRDKEEMFDRVSYQKGGAILHYLHQLTGDSAFYRAMRLYLSKNALQPTEAVHWRLAVEEATGKDWNWFFDQWYHRAGHPVLDIKYTYDDANKKLLVTVTQTQDESVGLYDLPLKVLLINGSEKQIIDWRLSKAKETFSYDYINGIEPVIVPDVLHVLPGRIIENKRYKQWLIQLNNCDDYVSQLLAVESVLPKDFGDASVQTILTKALSNKSAAIREAALIRLKFLENVAQRGKWKQDIVMLAENDGNNTVRSVAIELLGKWKEQDQKQMLTDAVKDSSYLVAGNALAALSNIDDSLAYSIARKNLKGRANTNLDTKAWNIIAKKALPADTALFLNAGKTDAENRKHLINDLAVYAINTTNENAFETGMKLLAQKIKEIENKTNRAYFAELLTVVKEALKPKDKKTAFYQFRMQSIKATAQKLNAEEQEKEVQKVYEPMLK